MPGLPRGVLLMCENGASTASRRDLIAAGHTPAEVAWWLERRSALDLAPLPRVTPPWA